MTNLKEILESLPADVMRDIKIRTDKLIEQENQRIEERNNKSRFPIRAVIHCHLDEESLKCQGLDCLNLDDKEFDNFCEKLRAIEIGITIQLDGNISIDSVNGKKLL